MHIMFFFSFLKRLEKIIQTLGQEKDMLLIDSKEQYESTFQNEAMATNLQSSVEPKKHIIPYVTSK